MKIMFICTGNICRSAMAHRLLEKKLEEIGNKDVEVYSCGVFAEDGDKADYYAIEVMKEYEVEMKSHQATNIRRAPMKEMDLILCATVSHKYSVEQLYPSLKEKIYTMKEYIGETKELDIADPWGYDITTFRFCAATIDRCLEKIIEKLQ